MSTHPGASFVWLVRLSMVCPSCIPGVYVGEKEGGNLPSKSSPWDWYSVGIVPIHSTDIHIFFLNVFQKFFVNSANTHISLSHTVHDREIQDICKGCVGGWYTGLCPGQVWGYVNSPPIPHQAPGIVCRAYH